MKPIHIFLLAVWLSIAGAAQAQQPVNIRQVGDTSIGTTVPVSGTVTTTLCTSSTCTETVVQPTGSNLHTVIDSGTVTTTLCTTGTCSEQVAGMAASGSTKAGNPVQVGGVFNQTNPTVTSGQVVELQATSDGTLEVTSRPTVSGFLTDYTGTGSTVFTLSATSGTVITANTIILLQLSCYYIGSGSGANINRTDTAGNVFELGFNIPGDSSSHDSNYIRNYTWGEKMVGLKMWASATNSVNCTITARQ